MGLSAGRVLGIAAVCLTAACTPVSAPAPARHFMPRPSTAFRTAWGPAPPLVRIMPLGDSITYGVGSADGAGYRARLEQRLSAAGLLVDFVGSRNAGPPDRDDDNEGHSGWTISRMARKVDRWLAAYRPDVVLLHIGTNDVRRNGYRNGAAKRLGVLLNRIRRDRPKAHLFVATIAGSRRPGLQREIDAYNRNVRRMLAARTDPLLHLVDQAEVRARSLHPNDAGYAAMADNWFTALTATVPALRVRPALRDAPALRAPSTLRAPTLRAPTLRAISSLRATSTLRDLGLVVATKADGPA